MFGLLRGIIRIKLAVAVAVLTSLAAAGWLRLRRERANWGVVSGDAARPLAGDDLVPDASIVDTRSLTIDAPAERIWPWLVQMGYGRGGWYSYDQLDMRGSSARVILPQHQSLAVGDIVPTHPGGGFVARIVDAPRALVLYLDTAVIKERWTRTDEEVPEATAGPMPAGLQAAGAMGDWTMPDFRASWAFVLQDEPGGKTRLIERFRVRAADAGWPQRMGMPFMGYGVFVMTRKQMLGIKARAEGRSRDEQPGKATFVGVPVTSATTDAGGEGRHVSEQATVEASAEVGSGS